MKYGVYNLYSFLLHYCYKRLFSIEKISLLVSYRDLTCITESNDRGVCSSKHGVCSYKHVLISTVKIFCLTLKFLLIRKPLLNSCPKSSSEKLLNLSHSSVA